MAYPFKPIRKVKLKKLSREREDSNLESPEFNQDVEPKFPDSECQRVRARPYPLTVRRNPST